MDRRLTTPCVFATTIMLLLRPASAADLQFRSSEIMGYDWALSAGGFTNIDAGAGHGFVTPPFGDRRGSLGRQRIEQHLCQRFTKTL